MRAAVGRAGAHVAGSGNPALRRCRIEGNGEYGVQVGGLGVGTLEECDISGHATAEVLIGPDGNPLLRGLAGMIRPVACDPHRTDACNPNDQLRRDRLCPEAREAVIAWGKLAGPQLGMFPRLTRLAPQRGGNRTALTGGWVWRSKSRLRGDVFQCATY